MTTNQVTVEFVSNPENEKLARVMISAFSTILDPTLEEMADMKTAVSEAVTNAIIHGYEKKRGVIRMELQRKNRTITVIISDKGSGIENIEKAMEPLFTTKPDQERTGMGFSFMEAFMDELDVVSKLGEGTTVTMKRTIPKREPYRK
ncbi:MAG: anti-sigma F factor [Lachnospiraceae bacterium]